MPREGTRPIGIWAKIAFVGPLPSAGGDFERASSVFDQSSGATPERARGTRALPSSWLPACGPVGSKQIEQIENFERNDGFYQDFSCFKDDNLQL